MPVLATSSSQLARGLGLRVWMAIYGYFTNTRRTRFAASPVCTRSWLDDHIVHSPQA